MTTVQTLRLVRVIQDLSTTRDMESAMAIVRSAAREIAQADGATFVLKDGDYCFYADEDAITPLWKGQRFPLKSCISGWCMINRTQTVIEDIYSDPRIPYSAYRPTFVQSLAMSPIGQTDPVGAIGVYWARRTTPSAETLQMLQALADSASVALRNLELARKLEERIADLRRAGRTKDEFLMIVSHELRTPLSAIIGWAELLREGLLSPDESAAAVESIERNARAQIRIVEDILDSSKILLERLEIECASLDLRRVVFAAVESARMEAVRRRIFLRSDVPAQPVTIPGDAGRLQQVMTNLLANAIKFSPEGSEIRVTLRTSGPSAHLTVEDDGEGITPDFLPHVFTRFRQGETVLTRRHGGLGLGLALVRHIVEAHRGTVKAESEGPGRGARFTILLPLANPLAGTGSAPDSSSTTSRSSTGTGGVAARQARVLVVDDEADSRALTAAVLGRAGFSVRTANCVRDAIDLCDETVDVIVCDLAMPEEDGCQLARRVRAGATTSPRGIPMVALTAHAGPLHRDEALASGFSRFLSKPFQHEELLSVVDELVENSMFTLSHPRPSPEALGASFTGLASGPEFEVRS